MQTKTSSAPLSFILILLFIVLFVLFIYTFLHEAGHALAGVLFGETLTEFNVNFWNFSAHVDMVGGDLTQTESAVQAAAGVSLPLLVWAIFMSVVPRSPNFSLRRLKLLSSMMVLNTLLAWIFIPILYISENAPASDDVTHFLQSSGIPPLWLTMLAVILYVLGWFYFLSRIERGKNELLLFGLTDRATILCGARKTLLVMTGALALCLAMAFLLNRSGAFVDRFSPPEGFAPIAQIDLATKAYSFESLTKFSLEEPTEVGVFITVRDINTSYFDLCVIGSNGYSAVVLHGEGYSASRDGGLWEENLLPGTYQLMLTSDQSPGTASIFLKAHE